MRTQLVSCVNGVKKYKYVNIIIVIAIEIIFWVFYLKKYIYKICYREVQC